MELFTSTLLLVYCLTFVSAPPDLDYFDYHQQMNEAFELLSEEDFSAARQKMERTFNQFDFVFAKDYLIAAQLFAKDKDYVNAIKYLEKALQGGCLLDCTQDIGVFNELKSLSVWNTLLTKEIELRKSYLKSIDINLLEEFSKRYQQEQEQKKTEYYQLTVYDNFKRIVEITEEKGFPGERLIGLDYEQLAPKCEDCDLGNSKVIVTFLHYDHPIAELGDSLFINAIRQGNLHPREFAAIYNYEKSKVSVLYKKSLKTFEPLPEYHFNLPFKKKVEDLELVNSDRKKFGIGRVEVDEKLELIADEYGMKFMFGYN